MTEGKEGNDRRGRDAHLHGVGEQDVRLARGAPVSTHDEDVHGVQTLEELEDVELHGVEGEAAQAHDGENFFHGEARAARSRAEAGAHPTDHAGPEAHRVHHRRRIHVVRPETRAAREGNEGGGIVSEARSRAALFAIREARDVLTAGEPPCEMIARAIARGGAVEIRGSSTAGRTLVRVRVRGGSGRVLSASWCARRRANARRSSRPRNPTVGRELRTRIFT